MNQFYSQVCKELSEGCDVCVATTVNQIGSAPREVGASFMVRPDGSIEGTIGGGRLEGEVIQAAQNALKESRSRLMHFRLKGADVAETEMICGGDVDVYLEPVMAGDRDALNIFKAAAEITARGGRALMVTPIDPGPLPSLAGRRLLLSQGQPPLGSLAAAPGLARELNQNLDDLISQGKPALWMQTDDQGRRVDCFVRPIKSKPMVYIFGGGHISLYLARLVKMVGFGLVVADDRAEYANPERFPQADDLWAGDYIAMLEEKELGPDAYVVIVTRGHIFDKEVLGRALKKQTVYLGMIGSRRKKAMIYQALEDEGFSKQDLETVHSPIGLDIGAETPEEIAVCIVAELIQQRSRRGPGNHILPGM